MFDLLFALLIGIAAGTLTGITPSLHVNLVASLLLASITLPFFASFSPLVLVVFIVSMSLTHSFLDFIPSIFLGAPDEDSFLAVLPGHELLKEGLGYEAVVLTLVGSLVALFIIILMTPLFFLFLPFVHLQIASVLPFLLVFISLYLVFREDEPIVAGTVFLLAAFLGVLTFNLPVKEPLLPLLSGLFGASALLVSLGGNITSLPPQRISKLRSILRPISKKNLTFSSILATLTAPLCSFLPGVGAGHAAIFAGELKETGKRQFLFLVGAINTIVIGLSFVTIFVIGRTRSGAAVAVKELLNPLTTNSLLVILGAIIISGITSFFLGLGIAKVFASNIGRVKYRALTFVTLLILLAINFFLTNTLGLLVLATGTAIGLFGILSRARRVNFMGALLVPTIIFYLMS